MDIKNIIQSLIFVYIGLVIAPVSIGNPAATEQIIIPLSAPGEPGLLHVNHYKGSIEVTGYKGKVVIVHAWYHSLKADSSLHLIPNAAIKLSAVEHNNVVTVKTDSYRRTIDMKIKVPRQFDLNLHNVDNGIITVSQVDGEMDINNVNGDIQVTDVVGSGVMSTVDGDILVRFNQVTPDMPMAFTSVEGKIDLTFPVGMPASFKIKSDYGDIYTDLPLVIEKRPATIKKRSATGGIKVTLDQWTHGTLSGGGPEILVKTLNGNIYLRTR